MRMCRRRKRRWLAATLTGAAVAMTFGVTPSELMSVLASKEACNRFRRAALHPRIEEMVARGMADSAQAAEIKRLRDEIAQLEQLVEDLRTIEGNR